MIPSTKFPVAWKLYCYAAILLCFIVVAKGTEIAEGTAVNVSSSSVSPSQLTTSITSNVIVSATNEDLVSALTKEISLITEYQRNHLDSENEDSPNLLRESRNLPQPQGADRGPGSLQATRVFDQAVKNAITSTSYYSTQYRGGAAETQKLSVATQNIVRTAVVGSSPDTRFGSVVTSNSDYYVQNIGGNLITYSYYTKTGGNGEPTYGAATISPTAVTSSQASSTLTAEERCVNCANVGVAPEINPVVRNAVNQILGSGQRVVLDRGTAVTYSTYISARGPFTTVGKVSIREPNTIHVGIKPVRVLQPGAGPVIARDFDSYVQKQGIRDLTISRYVNNNRGTQTVGFVSRQEPIIQPLPPQQIPIQDPVLGPVIHHDFDSYIQLQRGVSVTIRRESDIDPSGFTVYRLITDRPPIIEFTPLAISVSNPGLGPVIDSGFDHYVQLVDSTPVTVQRSVITEGNGITRVQMITFRERLTLTEPPRPITVAFPGRGPIVDSGFDHYIQDEDGTLVTYSRYATPQPDGLTAFGIITQRPLQTIPLPPISITIEQPGLGAVLEHSFDHYVQLINGNRVTVERQSEIGFGGETTYRFITQQNPIVVTLPPTRIEIANRQLGPVMLHDFNEYVQLIDGTRVTFSRYSSTGINGVVTYGKVTERERITRTIPPGFGAIAGGLDIAPPPITAIPGGVDDFARINLGLAKTYKYTNDAYGNQRVGAVTKFGVDNAALGLTSTVVTEPFVTLYKGSPVEGLRTKVHYYYINDVHRKPVYVTNIVGSNNYVPARISRPNVRQVDSVESQVICKHCQGQSGTFTYGRGVTPGERISSFANYKLRGGATARSIDDGLSRILALHKRQNNPAYFSIKPTIVNQAIVQIPGRSHTSLFTTFINGVAVTGTRTVHTPGKTQYTATVGGNSANLNLKNNIENIIRRENLKFQIGRPVDHVVRIPNVSYTSKFTTFKNGAPIVGTRTVYQGDAAHNLNSIQIVSVPFQNVRQVVRKVSSNTGISQQQLINVAPSGPVPSGIKIERVTTVGEDDQVTIKTATIMRGLASSGASVNPPTAVTETMTVQPKRTPGLKANPILTSTAFNENFATTIDGRQIIGKRTKTLFYVKPGQLRSSDTLKARNAQKFQQLYPTVYSNARIYDEDYRRFFAKQTLKAFREKEDLRTYIGYSEVGRPREVPKEFLITKRVGSALNSHNSIKRFREFPYLEARALMPDPIEKLLGTASGLEILYVTVPTVTLTSNAYTVYSSYIQRTSVKGNVVHVTSTVGQTTVTVSPDANTQTWSDQTKISKLERFSLPNTEIIKDSMVSDTEEHHVDSNRTESEAFSEDTKPIQVPEFLELDDTNSTGVLTIVSSNITLSTKSESLTAKNSTIIVTDSTDDSDLETIENATLDNESQESLPNIEANDRPEETLLVLNDTDAIGETINFTHLEVKILNEQSSNLPTQNFSKTGNITTNATSHNRTRRQVYTPYLNDQQAIKSYLGVEKLRARNKDDDVFEKIDLAVKVQEADLPKLNVPIFDERSSFEKENSVDIVTASGSDVNSVAVTEVK